MTADLKEIGESAGPQRPQIADSSRTIATRGNLGGTGLAWWQPPPWQNVQDILGSEKRRLFARARGPAVDALRERRIPKPERFALSEVRACLRPATIYFRWQRDGNVRRARDVDLL